MKKKYDFIFSIGERCACSEALRRSNLQFASFPFDWLLCAGLEQNARFVANHFKDFLVVEHLVDMNTENGDPENPCHVYRDQKTGIVFHHDFPVGLSFEEGLPLVREKYRRRINRLYQKIQLSKTVLAVYMESPTTDHPKEDTNRIISGYQVLCRAFPNQEVHVLYLVNNKGPVQRSHPCANVTVMTFDYKRKKPGGYDYSVDTAVLNKFFKGYRLNHSLGKRIHTWVLRLLAGFIPMKLVRRRFKKKHHV